MPPQKVCLNSHVYDALIVGSGAAGYNAAVHLHDKGVTDIAILTENRLAGTSRNTGSDKQTYYKLAAAGDQRDSPRFMAEALFAGGSMDGDLALCEAAHSVQEFFHLAAIGVDFPHNRFGEFVGYKTDHDPLQRGSSIGPYTSKAMTVKLEQQVLQRQTPIIDHSRVVKVLVTEGNGSGGAEKRAYGVIAFEGNGADGTAGVFRVYLCRNLIFATGGTPGLYSRTVYPLSQFGASGVLAQEGVAFANITEWQYGLASTKFRWNLSGSYQQVIPRYVSVDEAGVEREFLADYFPHSRDLGRAIFLKGYQWPFDPRKMADKGSSLVDVAVYVETQVKGRRVYLDFMHNPAPLIPFDAVLLDDDARSYLEQSKALAPTPVERLLKLNPASYELYKTHGIDLSSEYLEIDVLPQHNNGGAMVNLWWETSVKHLFAIGECAGTHGVSRPGGSALNAGQVGGYRAAAYIASHIGETEAAADWEEKALGAAADWMKKAVPNPALLAQVQEANSAVAALIRPGDGIEDARRRLVALGDTPGSGLSAGDTDNPLAFYKTREIILLSRMLLESIAWYSAKGGKSRGSYLILDKAEDLAKALAVNGVPIDEQFSDKVIVTTYDPAADSVTVKARPVRPIPETDTWFERVWADYRTGQLYIS